MSAAGRLGRPRHGGCVHHGGRGSLGKNSHGAGEGADESQPRCRRRVAIANAIDRARDDDGCWLLRPHDRRQLAHKNGPSPPSPRGGRHHPIADDVESDVERLRHHLRHLSARRDASDVALSASRSMGVRWSPGLCVLRGTARMVSGKLVETSFLTCEFFLIFQTINYELTTSGFGCRVSFTLTGAVI